METIPGSIYDTIVYRYVVGGGRYSHVIVSRLAGGGGFYH